MIFKLALLAAVGVALCNGIAAELEKNSADKHSQVIALKLSFLARLMRDWPYLLGLLLDILAWPLTLVAVHTLPLFVVQPIVAFSVVVTVLIDKVVLHRSIGVRMLTAMGIIFFGLILLSLTAQPQKAHAVSQITKWVIVFSPIILALLGSILIKTKRYSTAILASISGLAFGGTAVTGRMLVLAHPYWHLLYSPVLWSLFAYGLVGILTFTVALQRHHASVINATMVAFETIAPISIGIALLGDRPRQGQWILVISGLALAVIGTLMVSLHSGAD
jgi:drug/metabolite transporter (DMT)-like permease